MITGDDILNMNFYKKEKFTGSYQGMRYLIRKDSAPADSLTNAGASSGEAAASQPAASADSSPEDVTMTDVFRVTIWPGPYNFASTDDSKKTSANFPFTPEGKEEVVNWLNEQWRSRKEEWCK